MEGRRRDRNHSPQIKKKKSILDPVESEENGYLFPNPNKIMINVTKEPSDMHKNKKHLK
jgi:hypothetical protein